MTGHKKGPVAGAGYCEARELAGCTHPGESVRSALSAPAPRDDEQAGGCDFDPKAPVAGVSCEVFEGIRSACDFVRGLHFGLLAGLPYRRIIADLKQNARGFGKKFSRFPGLPRCPLSAPEVGRSKRDERRASCSRHRNGGILSAQTTSDVSCGRSCPGRDRRLPRPIRAAQ